MAQLVEGLLLRPDIRGSNPIISKMKYCLYSVNCIEITKKDKTITHFVKRV